VALSGICELRAGGERLELGSGPQRFDFAAEVPLVDGDPVYVVGKIEADSDGGPWRTSQRKRLVADGPCYAIGRGGALDFERHLIARANGRLIGLALLHFALALTLLGCLGLRPFV
jgi:hypothetical protein